MKNIGIKYNEDYEEISNKNNICKNFFNINIFIIITLINCLSIFYLIIENKKNKYLIKNLISSNDNINKIRNEILRLKNIFLKNKVINKKNKQNDFHLIVNKDMIGLKYPEIEFEKIKKDLNDLKFISSLIKFMEQLEIKLIFLEKEINITKLVSFYTSRQIFLEKIKVKYEDSNLKELHNIISWLVIHKSTQLKGIASDKYLVCKYAEIKLKENLCRQRIGIYNNIEEMEMDFKNISKLNNVVIKVSNGCGDKIFIYNNTKLNIEKIKKIIKHNFDIDYGIDNGEFFHLYSPKRIVLEKIFLPLTDLYEFKFYIVNNIIKMIYIRAYINNKIHVFYYDPNYKLIEKEKEYHLDLSKFDKKILNKIKYYAVKLSEDFRNFIRVDLYIFHNEIFLSELTFDPQNGRPFMRNHKIIKDAAKNWTKID